jgi:hypothetical protein
LNQSGERKERERRASPGAAKRERGGSSRVWHMGIKASDNDAHLVEASGGPARCTPEQGSGAMENGSGPK